MQIIKRNKFYFFASCYLHCVNVMW